MNHYFSNHFPFDEHRSSFKFLLYYLKCCKLPLDALQNIFLYFGLIPFGRFLEARMTKVKLKSFGSILADCFPKELCQLLTPAMSVCFMQNWGKWISHVLVHSRTTGWSYTVNLPITFFAIYWEKNSLRYPVICSWFLTFFSLVFFCILVNPNLIRIYLREFFLNSDFNLLVYLAFCLYSPRHPFDF